jgi:hypothetical protein
MDLQGDVGQMEAHLGPFGDSVNLHTRLVHSLHRTCNKLGNHFGHTRWNSYVVKWKLISVHLKIVLISTQDRCMVCTKCAIGSETFWAYPMELLGDVGQVEARFGLLGEHVNLGAK